MRTTFCSSALVQLLGPWVPVQPADPMDFAERLGVRLGPLHAIALQAALQQLHARKFPPRRTPATLARTLGDDVDRVRQALARAIAQQVEPWHELQLPSRKGERLGPPAIADAIAAGYQRRHVALQRQMDQMVAALRDHVRGALSACSPRLQRLAVLDAAMAQVLAAREQAALPRTGRVLEQRLRTLRRAHEQAVAAGASDSEAGDWVRAFDTEWRQALLAERDLRLDPVVGLVEAAAEEDNE